MIRNKLIKTIRQATAGLLAGAMVLTGAPLGNITANAAVLPPNAELNPAGPTANVGVVNVGGNTYTFGSSDTTAYAFGNSSGHNGADGSSPPSPNSGFNISGIVNEAHRGNNNKGYYNADLSSSMPNPILKTGFGSSWWHGFYGVGKPKYIANSDGSGDGNFRTLDASSPIDITGGYNAGGKPSSTNTSFSSTNIGLLLNTGNSHNGEVHTINAGGNNVELRQEVKPSDDGQYIIVEYTAYNTSNNTVDIMVGHETDTELGNLDAVPIFITSHGKNGAELEGLHFHSNGWTGSGAGSASGKNFQSFAAFDIYSTRVVNGVQLAGMEKRDSSDPSETRVRAGKWSSEPAGGSHRDWVFSQSKPGYINPGDSAAAFSAYFNLQGHEIKKAKFAIAIKPMVMYVKSGSGNTDANKYEAGFMGDPMDSIEEAVKRIKSLLGAGNNIAKAYIYLQGDVTLNKAIEIPAGLDITIQSADFSTATGGPSDTWNTNEATVNSTTFTINRAAGYDGPLFKLDTANATNPSSATSRLTFLDVNVDGGNIDAESPLIDAKVGKVTVRQNVELRNNKVTKPVASAISLSGSAELDLNAKLGEAKITGNTGTTESAVKVESSAAHPVTINGKVSVTGNTNTKGKANVDLGTKMLWVESGNTFTGTISVNTTNAPQADNQATPIADYEDRASGASMPYAKSNFEPDTKGQSIEEADVSNYETGTTNNQLSGRMYLTAPFKGVTVSYVDSDGNTIGVNTVAFGGAGYDPNKFAIGTQNPVTKQKGVGAIVGETADGGLIPLPTLSGYVVSEVKITPDYAEVGKTHTVGSETINGTIDLSSGGTYGKIGGTIYSEDVDISVKYIKAGKTYKFDVKGGGAIADKYEAISPSSTLGNLPKPVRTGYDFVKWVRYDDINGNGSFDTGEPDSGTIATGRPSAGANLGDFGTDTTPFPAPSGNPETITLYAVWTPGSSQYEVRRNYSNSNPSLPLNLGSDADNYIITATVDHDPANIPLYKYVAGSRTPGSVGTLDPNAAPTPNAGHFNIPSMPAYNVAVNYKYVVDSTQTANFTVRHVDAGGTAIGSAPPVVAKRAEQSITAQKQNITGYTYDHMTIDAGYNTDLSHYIVGLDNPTLLVTNDSANGVFSGFMPNQPVTVTFHYNADAGMNIVRKYLDHEVGDRLIHSKVDGPLAPGSAVNFPFGGMDELYGYVYGSSSVEDLDPAHTATVSVDGSGNITGNMSASGNGVKVNFLLNHDASKWRTINFAVANAPYEKGSINPLPAGAPTSFLANDGSSVGASRAYSFNKLTAEGYIPTLTPNRYYMFDGWYLDAAATMPVNGGDTFPTDTAPLTLYAKFVEDPSQWFDINFVAGTNGSISAPNTLHTPYDYTWGQITPQLPTATPVINYNFNGWDDPSGNHMMSSSTLTNHATYKAIFGKDPNTWGTNVGAISPYGRIGSDGSGEIEIRGTTPGNVYVISKPDGEIVAVVKGDPNGNVTTVPDMIPGAHYNVQEGTPDTIATVGQHTSSVTGSSVSAPQDVFIPTVDSNYNVGYDPNNEGMAQIVINPADPDADYALIDENGNVLQYPGSDNGWMTPVGSNPSTVTFDNLNPNETYTVVARKRGDSSLPNPLMKLADGTQIVANPGDMSEVPKYVVETREGIIVSVKDTTVNADAFNDAHAGETVSIHADAVNSNGKNFLYWKVLAGRAVGVSGNITQADYSFTLSNSNIVLKAVYEPVKIAGDDADLHEELRGTASQGEFGLEPAQIPALANTLTTPADRALQSVNGANVDYRVIFNKRNSTSAESALVKPESISGKDHPDAYTAAYSLDIKLERYVDGRRVDAGIVATASDAAIDVIAQLPGEDVDQLDYQLFDVTTGTAVETIITTDVANNAGLVKFTGNLLHTYVMVYSKTFKLTFIDNKPVLDHLFLNDTSRNFYHRFKVRRKESVEDSYYSSDYDIVTAYAKNDQANKLKTPFEDIYGVQYDYQNWSKKEDKLAVYDTTSPVTKRLVVFAYYSNNKPQVDKARVDLGDTIEQARLLTGDPYLKLGEIDELTAAIAKAVETLRQARDLVSPDGTTYLRMANYEELQQAIDALRELIDKYYKLARDREDARNRKTGGASGGGNTSNGRGSRLLTPGEKSKQTTARNEASNTRAFVLGVDGAWERNPVTGGWSFVLNGGTPLNDMWGMISFTDSTGKKVSRWYYFDGQSTMATGWVYDSKNGYWYYMNTTEGTELGQMVTGWVRDPKTNKWYFMNDTTGIMVTGWHLDKQDNRWYYLTENGDMLIGWNNIGGKYYYFNPNAPQETYVWDANAFKWNYLNNGQRPYGSMYAGEQTPDGYTVDASGAWN